jgi:hypothetical protein
MIRSLTALVSRAVAIAKSDTGRMVLATVAMHYGASQYQAILHEKMDRSSELDDLIAEREAQLQRAGAEMEELTARYRQARQELVDEHEAAARIHAAAPKRPLVDLAALAESVGPETD